MPNPQVYLNPISLPLDPDVEREIAFLEYISKCLDESILLNHTTHLAIADDVELDSVSISVLSQWGFSLKDGVWIRPKMSINCLYWEDYIAPDPLGLPRYVERHFSLCNAHELAFLEYCEFPESSVYEFRLQEEKWDSGAGSWSPRCSESKEEILRWVNLITDLMEQDIIPAHCRQLVHSGLDVRTQKAIADGAFRAFCSDTRLCLRAAVPTQLCGFYLEYLQNLGFVAIASQSPGAGNKNRSIYLFVPSNSGSRQFWYSDAASFWYESPTFPLANQNSSLDPDEMGLEPYLFTAHNLLMELFDDGDRDPILFSDGTLLDYTDGKYGIGSKTEAALRYMRITDDTDPNDLMLLFDKQAR